MTGFIQQITISLGAFLLFLVQPMIGNTLLPTFGGTASVWSICLATFQILLVGGYAYAHMISNKASTTHSTKRRLYLHSLLLFVSSSLLFCANSTRAHLGSVVQTLPQPLAVFTVILLLVAIPYVILSANSSLVQDISGGRYGLYSVSNLGSLLGLWAYPLLFESFLPLTAQWVAFASLSLFYTILFAYLSIKGSARTRGASAIVSDCTCKNTRPAYLNYFILSAISCFLLNAVSTHLCSDITPIPFVWVALLSIYLISYIISFTERGSRFTFLASIFILPLSIVATWHMGLFEYRHFLTEMTIASLFLFIGGMLIHSRLYLMRPAPEHLTAYYLLIAVGGAVGGAICSFVMPLVSSRIVEYPISIALLLAIALVDIRRYDSMFLGRIFAGKLRDLPQGSFVAAGLLISLCTALVGSFRVGSVEGDVVKRYRNFYGTGCVARKSIGELNGISCEANEFRCNGTTHGMQVVDGNWKSRVPTVYYAEHAGGLPLLHHRKAVAMEPMRVALCGMGIGTLASYANHGDFYRFYEINPAVADIANDKSLFSFVSDARGTVEIVVDDARKSLEREKAAGEAKYDVIVVDVFNGDSIPPHMATEEAFRLYLDRLEDDGILAFHISNWHLDLMPMIKAASTHFKLNVEAFYCVPTFYAFASTWAFMSRNALPKMYAPKHHELINFAIVPDIPLMTDEKHSLLPYLQFIMSGE